MNNMKFCFIQEEQVAKQREISLGEIKFTGYDHEKVNWAIDEYEQEGKLPGPKTLTEQKYLKQKGK